MAGSEGRHYFSLLYPIQTITNPMLENSDMAGSKRVSSDYVETYDPEYFSVFFMFLVNYSIQQTPNFFP